MEKLPSLSDYLKAKGVDSNTPAEDIATLKKQYWKVYHQQYYHHRKKGYHRFTMRLTAEEYKRLYNQADLHQKKSLSQFIKESALAYLDKQYIPRDRKAAMTLTKSIRKIGNSINQVVQSIHRTAKRQRMTGAFADDGTLVKLQREYEFLVNRVTDLEKEMKVFISLPPKRVGDTLWEILSQEPDKISQVRSLLNEIEAKIKNNASD